MWLIFNLILCSMAVYCSSVFSCGCVSFGCCFCYCLYICIVVFSICWVCLLLMWYWLVRLLVVWLCIFWWWKCFFILYSMFLCNVLLERCSLWMVKVLNILYKIVSFGMKIVFCFLERFGKFSDVKLWWCKIFFISFFRCFGVIILFFLFIFINILWAVFMVLEAFIVMF